MAYFSSSEPQGSSPRWRVAGLLASLGLLALPTLAQPTVSSVSPARNLRNAPRASSVSFTLSQDLTAGSATALKVFGSRRGGLVAGAASVSGNTVTFDPSIDFQTGETVYATLTNAAQNTSNQALAQPQVLSFIAAATNGSGVFTAAPSLTLPAGGQGATVGDVNGDGLMDIVMGTAANTLVTFLNQGGGIFPATPSASVPTSTGLSQIVLGDVDNDGDLDAVIPSFSISSVTVHRNTGGVLGAPAFLGTGANPRWVSLADVNGDAYLDILTANVGNNNVTLNLNNAGTFAAATAVASVGSGPYALGTADLNGDGRMDLVTVNSSNATSVSVRLGNGDGTFSGTGTINLGFTPFGIALGDVNGDNIADIVTANRFGPQAGVLLGVGNGTFGAVSLVATGGSEAIDVALGDLDADGDLDLVVGSYASNNLSVMTNNGAASFSAPTIYAASTNPFVVATGDLDGNGSLDIVCSNISSPTVTVLRNGALADLTVSTTANIPAGAYNNITVTGTGVGTLAGPVLVAGTFTVNSGGVLATNCQPLTGNGSFNLLPGAELRICDAAGITSTGSTGAVQVSGARSFSPGASYTYTGTMGQVTGTGLPNQVHNLTVSNSVGVGLSAATSVVQVLRLSSGNLRTNGQALTLLSTAGGTAMVVNTGAAEVTGNVTMQRYIDPSLNAGLGYRHYSSPVQSTTVADLTTAGFSPVVNPTYNTVGNTITPFPTVYGYNEARLAGTSATTQNFDYGYFSPNALTESLTRGRGYTVNISATEKVDLAGTLNNGTVAVGALSRGTEAASGWQLLGNPYPAPLDWNVARTNLPVGVQDAIYVYKSSDQYNGTYQFYQNGFGTLPGGLIGSMQGFFIRVSQPVASFSFQNAWRVTNYADASFNRPAADTRPLVQLDLVSAQGTHEPAFIYFENGATAGVDNHYDAEKLANTTGLNLSSTAAGTKLAVNGLPLAAAAATVIPLNVGVPTTGTYTLQAAALLNLPNTEVYLHDAVTGQHINLKQQGAYSFSASNAALITSRFTLSLGAQRVLSTHTGLSAASVSVYPNPAHTSFTLLVPAVRGESQAKLTLYNVLGQSVREATLALPAAGAQTTLDVQGLPLGVYVLRVKAGASVITKHVVVN